MQVNAEDCMGCGNCADICPAKKPALVMKPLEPRSDRQVPNSAYASSLPVREGLVSRNTVKGSQFYQPLLEFSGACAGCGETPYAKLLTQLFGERMVIGNATGCSSIWGGSAPSIPYCVNADGCGPTWGNSLFEDPAEFTYGMFLGQLQQRQVLVDLVTEALERTSMTMKAAMQGWLENMKDAEGSKRYGDQIREMLLPLCGTTPAGQNRRAGFLFTKRSYWIFVGDGSAYDISFGGIDHVLATGEDINVIVYDTEVYSNTGGQSSKATPTGLHRQVCRFRQEDRQKGPGRHGHDLRLCLRGQCGHGGQQAAADEGLHRSGRLRRPVADHGLFAVHQPRHQKGHGQNPGGDQLAVKSGYWPLYRYNPMLAAEGKNPFILDSKEPDGSLQEYLAGEVRYAALQMIFPGRGQKTAHPAGGGVHRSLRRPQTQGRCRVCTGPAVGRLAAPVDGADDACTLAGTAEHAGRAGADDACDDGRAGK
jgi:pyruvate-ferredoxin/flavodoxin oxidoreductase